VVEECQIRPTVTFAPTNSSASPAPEPKSTTRSHCAASWCGTPKPARDRLADHLLEFGATTIAAIYKERWQIELFFKALKQNLTVKTFVGTSENALRIQIWTALIALLLLKWLHHLSRAGWSLSNLASLLRLTFSPTAS